MALYGQSQKPPCVGVNYGRNKCTNENVCGRYNN